MSYITTGELSLYLRRDDYGSAGDPLESVLQQAIDSAEATVENFIGDTLGELSDSFGSLPAPILSAIYVLSGIEFDANDVQREQTLRARAESLLRPYRRETGIAGGCTTES